jgi:hypothetical protein
MRPMLDDLELPQVQRLRTCDQRALAEMRAPGMSGSLLQNLGRRATCVLVGGIASGPDAQAFAQKLEAKFRARKPVPFTADIVADAAIDRVLIDDLRLVDMAGTPQRFAYVLTLSEFIEPVEPATAAGLDADILGDAQNLLGDLVAGVDVGQVFATGLENFVGQLGGFLTRLQEFRKANGG